ncbi:MAG: InlB B-repeat-containing protein [Clostridiales bacterium]|nr:InlB B-repeat-containing protein [Clostridiales bacterium]
MKKLLTALAALTSASLISVCAVGCGGTNSSETPDDGKDDVTYSIAWYDESGNVLATQNLKEGTAPTYTYDKQDTAEWDYTFEGWSLTAGGTVLQTLPKVSADASYYAIVSKIKQKYTVTFNSGEGSSVPSVQKDYGDTLENLAEPTPPDGKYFIEWCTDSACNTAAVLPLTVTANVTLYAKYGEGEATEYTVRWYDEEGNSLATQTLRTGATAAYAYDKQDTAEWDYTFEGWSLTAGGTVLQTLPKVNADASYYAIVSKVKQKYTVTFDCGAGSSVPSVQKDYGTALESPTSPTAPRGMYFVGWYMDSACQNAATFPLTVTGNVTLYAAYADIEYTISWYDEDGNSLSTQKLKEGATVVPYAYSKQDTAEWDYTFEGWSLTAGGAVLQTLPNANADASYYAIVSKVKQKYTVTFNSGEGSAVPSVQKDYGDTIVNPTAPTPPEGKRFLGWCTDSACQNVATFPLTVTSNVTLYAAYGENVDVKALLSSLLSGYQLDPYSYIPEAMLPDYSTNLVNASTVKKTEEDYSSFVSKSQMPSKGFGEQWHMIADNLKQSERFFNALSVVESVSAATVTIFNNHVDSNPSDYAHYAFKHGIYDVTIDCSGGKIYYVLDYTIGGQEMQIALSMNLLGGARNVRIQLSDANALTYTITDNGYTFAIKYLGVRRAMFDVSRDANGKVTGHINEFLTASGVTDRAIASAADFYIDGNYVSAVGNKADGMVVFDGYISELYNATTGKLISYEVRETKSSLTFNTLWFDLADVSGINSVKYEKTDKTENFYVNNSSTAWEAKKVGGISLKTASRRYDIEFRTQYFYAIEDGEVVEVAVKVPMLFVQEENYGTLTADVADKNSGVNVSVNISTTNLNKQLDDYDTLVDEFIENKSDITVDYIIEYIGDAVEFN